MTVVAWDFNENMFILSIIFLLRFDLFFSFYGFGFSFFYYNNPDPLEHG